MRRRTLLTLLTLVPLIACGGDSTALGTPRMEGTWHLATVNGSAVPAVFVQYGTVKLEIVSDVIIAVESGSYTQMTEFRMTESGQATTYSQPDAGTFTLNGAAVSIVSNSDGDIATGSIAGNTMTFSEAGFTLVYRRD